MCGAAGGERGGADGREWQRMALAKGLCLEKLPSDNDAQQHQHEPIQIGPHNLWELRRIRTLATDAQ